MVASVSAILRALTAATVVLCLAALSACGEDEPVRRATSAAEPAATPPTGREGVPTRAEIERFGRVTLPASAEGLQARRESGMDEAIFVRFTLAAADLEAFVASGGFTQEPQPDDRAVVSDAGLGWELDAIDRVEGLNEVRDGLGRQLLIDLDRPGRPVVYFVASTI